jgi:hypothetical protein
MRMIAVHMLYVRYIGAVQSMLVHVEEQRANCKRDSVQTTNNNIGATTHSAVQTVTETMFMCRYYFCVAQHDM